MPAKKCCDPEILANRKSLQHIIRGFRYYFNKELSGIGAAISPEQKAKAKIRQQKWYQNNKDYARSRNKTNWQSIKLLVLQHYSGKDIPECKCCGTTIFGFLTLDHVNTDGAKTRKLGAKSNYYFLVAHNFETNIELQVLCYNCNCGRYRNNNICPCKELKPSTPC